VSEFHVLEERISALTARMDKMEKGNEKLEERIQALTVEIRVLGTKMVLFSGALSFAVTTAVTVGLKFL
jgi:chromosome segregation ATPase